jgi:RNA polymerase sigma factor (TIGR02999 family)
MGMTLGPDALFAQLYTELHGLAQRELARRRGHSGGLGATTLLHEAYLAMRGRGQAVFPDRARFIAYAACVMRTLVIDDVRRRFAQKRGGPGEDILLRTDSALGVVEDPRWLIDLTDALDALATDDAALAEVVDLKFFCGFSVPEIAALCDVSERTVKRNWERARVYLHRALRGPSGA